MAVEIAKVMLREFRDPHKATSDYLSSIDGIYSWANTPAELHQHLLGTEATNDPAERPFGGETYQIESFGRIALGNAAAVAHARINGIFHRSLFNSKKEKEEEKVD